MIKITADSTCDLSKEILYEMDITLTPLVVMIGEKAYHDGVDIVPQISSAMLSVTIYPAKLRRLTRMNTNVSLKQYHRSMKRSYIYVLAPVSLLVIKMHFWRRKNSKMYTLLTHKISPREAVTLYTKQQKWPGPMFL